LTLALAEAFDEIRVDQLFHIQIQSTLDQRRQGIIGKAEIVGDLLHRSEPAKNLLEGQITNGRKGAESLLGCWLRTIAPRSPRHASGKRHLGLRTHNFLTR